MFTDSRPVYRDTSDTCLASEAFISHGGRFHEPFLLSLTLNSETSGQHCQVLLLVRVETWSSPLIASSPVFWFWWFPSLPKVSPPGICSVDQDGLQLRDSQASAFRVLRLKVCITIHYTFLYFLSLLYNSSSQVKLSWMVSWSEIKLPLFHVTWGFSLKFYTFQCSFSNCTFCVFPC